MRVGDPLELAMAGVGRKKETVNRPRVFPDLSLHNFDLRKKLVSVQQFTTDALFSWKVAEGINDPDNHELYVLQGGLTLPSW